MNSCFIHVSHQLSVVLCLTTMYFFSEWIFINVYPDDNSNNSNNGSAVYNKFVVKVQDADLNGDSSADMILTRIFNDDVLLCATLQNNLSNIKSYCYYANNMRVLSEIDQDNDGFPELVFIFEDNDILNDVLIRESYSKTRMATTQELQMYAYCNKINNGLKDYYRKLHSLEEIPLEIISKVQHVYRKDNYPNSSILEGSTYMENSSDADGDSLDDVRLVILMRGRNDRKYMQMINNDRNTISRSYMYDGRFIFGNTNLYNTEHEYLIIHGSESTHGNILKRNIINGDISVCSMEEMELARFARKRISTYMDEILEMIK